MLAKVASPKHCKFHFVTITHFKNNAGLKDGLNPYFPSAKKVAITSMIRSISSKEGVSDIDSSSSDRRDNESDVSISEITPEDKDDIEKEKKTLLARVRVQVSTSLILPVYPVLRMGIRPKSKWSSKAKMTKIGPI